MACQRSVVTVMLSGVSRGSKTHSPTQGPVLFCCLSSDVSLTAVASGRESKTRCKALGTQRPRLQSECAPYLSISPSHALSLPLYLSPSHPLSPSLSVSLSMSLSITLSCSVSSSLSLSLSPPPPSPPQHVH